MKPQLRKSACFTLLFGSFFMAFAQDSARTVSGRITDGQTPLYGVSVVNDNQGTSASTDNEGRYEVNVDKGDVLVFGYLGRDTIRIKTEDVTRILNLEMKPKTYALNEVTVADRRKQKISEARASEKNDQVIKTAYGDVDLRSSGFSGRVIDNELLNPGAINLAEAVRGRIPGLKVNGPIGGLNNTLSFGRNKRQPVGYDVDGVVLRDMPNFIDVSNIEKIALLPALGAVAKYGRIGAGGMIVITTKNRSNLLKFEESGEPYDHAKRRDNIYANDALTLEQVRENEAIYLKKLLRSKDGTAAKKVYRDHEAIYKGSYPFLLDSYEYFFMERKDGAFAEQILKDHWEVFDTDPVALKALGYIYQANGEHEKAHEVFKEVFILRPGYTQSYFDLADSYEDLGDYKKSALLLLRYKYLEQEGFFSKSTGELELTMARELTNLVFLHGEKVLPSKESRRHMAKESVRGKRLVFEWNDSEAEFELQFVAPSKNYHKWSHTLSDNADIITDEKNLGYSMSEYFIDHSLKGDWSVQIKYLGNKQLTPSYLKATIYHDYGLPTQRKEVKTFRLGVKNVNQQLFELNTAVADIN